MAIKAEERQIGTQPSGRLIREFRTQLPSPDMSGLANLGRVLGDIGEREFIKKEEADKEQAGLDVEKTVPIKNEDGSYSRLMPPEGGSAAYRKAFEVASDRAYVNSVYRDFEFKANAIASDITLTPEAQIARMQALSSGTLAGVDPRVRGSLEGIFSREVNQRQGSILNRAASEQRSTLISQNVQAADEHFKKYIELSSINATEEATVAFNSSRASFEAATRMRNSNEAYVSQELAVFDKRKQEIDAFLPTLDKIRQGIAGKNIAPDELDRFISMLRPGASPKGSVAFDMTDTDVARSMSQETRNYVRGLLDNLSKNYSAEVATSSQDRSADELNLYFDAGNTSLPENISANVHSAAARKALQSRGLDPFTPQGLTAIARLHNGNLPTDLYRTRFNNIHEIVNAGTPEGKALLEDRLQLYRQMKAIPTPTGVQDRTEIISATERAFLWHVDNAAGDNIELAAKAAKGLIDRGLGMSPEKQVAFVLSQPGMPAKKKEDIVKAARENFVRGQTGGSFFKPSYEELPVEASNFIVTEVAKAMVLGIPYTQAVKDAARDFTSNWTKSNIIISNRPGGTNNPWVKKEEQVPLAYNALTQQQSDEYLKPYIEKFLKERINLDEAKARGIPSESLEWGKNVRLRPLSNIAGPDRTYELVYYEPDARGISVLKTKENQTAIIVPNGARIAFEKQSAFENVRRTLEGRESLESLSDAGNIVGFSGQPEVSTTTPVQSSFNIDLQVIEPVPTEARLLGRTRAAVPASAQRYVDYTRSKLTEYGMEGQASYFVRTLGLESGFNALAKNPRSGAFGLGQMLNSTWAKYGRGDRQDPEAQIDAMIRFTRDNVRSFVSASGREPSNGELYLMHQQGFGGANALLSNPDANAMETLTRVTGSRSQAVAAIANNLPKDLAKYSGTITSRQFTTFWMSKFN